MFSMKPFLIGGMWNPKEITRRIKATVDGKVLLMIKVASLSPQSKFGFNNNKHLHGAFWVQFNVTIGTFKTIYGLAPW